LRLTRLSGENLSQADFQTKANKLIADARVNAEDSIKLDPTNFENYLQLGGVYDTLGSLGIQGTTDPARENYRQALLLNPKSPRVLFTLARLEYLGGDKVKAKQYLTEALTERPNYLEAVSFLVQLDLQEKNPDDAIAALKSAIAAEPTNFLLHFALGYLDYAKRDYQSAIPEFEGAVILNPVYADAKYFLGLSYYRVGRKDEALQQFTDVQTLNPDNKDVAKILLNLKQGRDPFDVGYTTPTQPVSDALKDLNKGTPAKPAN
jgi:tetratricopeptide (TPR) repeat protein